MNHGSLFSGIGGFDLAAEWMGWNNIFHCEWNEFGQQILEYYWPEAIRYEDITKTDFTIHKGEIDILTGGFPCQPYSQAGKRLGKEDDRHLWPEMLRAIREIQPHYIVGENVRGLTNWNGGMVFDEVQADMESEGYEVLPFLLPACAVNAPHRRDRIWFVGYSNERSRQEHGLQTGREVSENDTNSSGAFTNNKSSNDCQPIREQKKGQEQKSGKCTKQRIDSSSEIKRARWGNFPNQSPIYNGDDGISDRLDAITFPKWRSESIKAGGNAIVPQVALQIFRAIQELTQTEKL